MNKKLGELIRGLRKQKGISLRKLAEEVGVSYVNISYIENGRIKTSKDVFNFAESEANGIVVGSSIISKIQKCIEDNTPKHKIANIIKEYVRELSKGLSKK